MKKTLIGAGLTVLGFGAIMYSPSVGVNTPFPANIVAYSGIFLLGFVSMLYGVGLVLVENDMWG